eukprot:1194837-Prorocentrum_minimum.AAC.7
MSRLKGKGGQESRFWRLEKCGIFRTPPRNISMWTDVTYGLHVVTCMSSGATQLAWLPKGSARPATVSVLSALRSGAHPHAVMFSNPQYRRWTLPYRRPWASSGGRNRVRLLIGGANRLTNDRCRSLMTELVKHAPP